MRWGVDEEGGLVLVSEEQNDKILIFDHVKPTVDPKTEFLSLVMSKPVDGKAITLGEESILKDDGLCQTLKVGDSKDALKVFFDDSDFIRDSKHKFQALNA